MQINEAKKIYLLGHDGFRIDAEKQTSTRKSNRRDDPFKGKELFPSRIQVSLC